MRSLGDQMKLLGNNIEGFRGDLRDVGVDLKDVRERLITMEAAKIEARLEREIARLDRELAMAAVERRRIEDDAAKEAAVLHEKINKNSDALSNMTGRLIPLGALGMVLAAAIVGAIMKVF